jgi:hypothetical protein
MNALDEKTIKQAILDSLSKAVELQAMLGLIEAYFKTHPNPATMGFARANVAGVIRTLEVAKVFEK